MKLVMEALSTSWKNEGIHAKLAVMIILGPFRIP